MKSAIPKAINDNPSVICGIMPSFSITYGIAIEIGTAKARAEPSKNSTSKFFLFLNKESNLSTHSSIIRQSENIVNPNIIFGSISIPDNLRKATQNIDDVTPKIKFLLLFKNPPPHPIIHFYRPYK
jgi:hypothetical protein